MFENITESTTVCFCIPKSRSIRVRIGQCFRRSNHLSFHPSIRVPFHPSVRLSVGRAVTSVWVCTCAFVCNLCNPTRREADSYSKLSRMNNKGWHLFEWIIFNGDNASLTLSLETQGKWKKKQMLLSCFKWSAIHFTHRPIKP